ncbi:MAG: DNA repair protein RecN, partial [Acidimicrobiales bacterium]
DRAAELVGQARRAHKELLGDAVQSRFAQLAMPKATLRVEVSEEDPGNDVQFLFEANSGASLLPLNKVASGGELARVMLGLRLVLSAGPPTVVFDEVDAGIGGHAALAVGRALAELGNDRQVLVVTHLPQVAAAADAQMSIRKDSVEGDVVSDVYALSADDRHEELARMLSGQVSDVAIEHARELLVEAQVGASP